MTTWEEGKYNSDSLDLGIVKVQVWWDSGVSRGDPTGYKFSYGAFRSKGLYSSMDEAKTAAIRSVRKRLTEALQALDSLTPTE